VAVRVGRGTADYLNAGIIRKVSALSGMSNWASVECGAKLVGFSSQIKGGEAANVLHPKISQLWLSEEGVPQWICIALKPDIFIRTIGWHCWHPYITNPKIVTIHTSGDGTKFKPWDTFTAERTKGNQLFCCTPISSSIYPFIAVEIVETFGGDQTYMNRVFMFSDEIPTSVNYHDRYRSSPPSTSSSTTTLSPIMMTSVESLLPAIPLSNTVAIQQPSSNELPVEAFPPVESTVEDNTRKISVKLQLPPGDESAVSFPEQNSPAPGRTDPGMALRFNEPESELLVQIPSDFNDNDVSGYEHALGIISDMDTDELLPAGVSSERKTTPSRRQKGRSSGPKQSSLPARKTLTPNLAPPHASVHKVKRLSTETRRSRGSKTSKVDDGVPPSRLPEKDSSTRSTSNRSFGSPEMTAPLVAPRKRAGSSDKSDFNASTTGGHGTDDHQRGSFDRLERGNDFPSVDLDGEKKSSAAKQVDVLVTGKVGKTRLSGSKNRSDVGVTMSSVRDDSDEEKPFASEAVQLGSQEDLRWRSSPDTLFSMVDEKSQSTFLNSGLKSYENRSAVVGHRNKAELRNVGRAFETQYRIQRSGLYEKYRNSRTEVTAPLDLSYDDDSYGAITDIAGDINGAFSSSSASSISDFSGPEEAACHKRSKIKASQRNEVCSLTKRPSASRQPIPPAFSGHLTSQLPQRHYKISRISARIQTEGGPAVTASPAGRGSSAALLYLAVATQTEVSDCKGTSTENSKCTTPRMVGGQDISPVVANKMSQTCEKDVTNFPEETNRQVISEMNSGVQVSTNCENHFQEFTDTASARMPHHCAVTTRDELSSIGGVTVGVEQYNEVSDSGQFKPAASKKFVRSSTNNCSRRHSSSGSGYDDSIRLPNDGYIPNNYYASLDLMRNITSRRRTGQRESENGVNIGSAEIDKDIRTNEISRPAAITGEDPVLSDISSPSVPSKVPPHLLAHDNFDLRPQVAAQRTVYPANDAFSRPVGISWGPQRGFSYGDTGPPFTGYVHDPIVPVAELRARYLGSNPNVIDQKQFQRQIYYGSGNSSTGSSILLTATTHNDSSSSHDSDQLTQLAKRLHDALYRRQIRVAKLLIANSAEINTVDT
jgi:hypothetical protein